MDRQALPSLVVMLLCVTATARPNQTPVFQNQAAARRPTAPASGNENLIDTSKWKIYRNEKHGFEVKYPETWTVHVGSGTGPDIIALHGPFRGDERATLQLTIQPNQNPRRRSIEGWFADQLRALGATPESTEHTTIGGQAAVFMANTNSFGTRRDTFTLLHETDVLSLSYSSKAEHDPTYAAIVATFRVVKSM